jgi:hypothetical protein
MEDSSIIAPGHAKTEQFYARSANWSKFRRLNAENGYLEIGEREEIRHFQTSELRYRTIGKNRFHLKPGLAGVVKTVAGNIRGRIETTTRIIRSLK